MDGGNEKEKKRLCATTRDLKKHTIMDGWMDGWMDGKKERKREEGTITKTLS